MPGACKEMSINDSFVIESRFFDPYKWWGNLSSIQRQNFLRYRRLERMEKLRQAEKDRRYQEYLVKQWLKQDDKK